MYLPMSYRPPPQFAQVILKSYRFLHEYRLNKPRTVSFHTVLLFGVFVNFHTILLFVILFVYYVNPTKPMKFDVVVFFFCLF